MRQVFNHKIFILSIFLFEILPMVNIILITNFSRVKRIMKIIYIHGFNSAGYGDKINYLRKAFGDENVITPTLPYNPEKAIKLLEYLVEKLKDDDFYLVGTSLGGYYALYLTNKYNVPSIIINPSLEPYKSLESQVGVQKNYKTDEEYEFKKEYLDYLKKIKFTKKDLEKHKDKIFVYLNENDIENMN